MAEKTIAKTGTPDSDLHEIAGGWILERKGTEVPTFLKATYIVVALACIAYSILWVNGDVGDSERGRLVQQFNSATQFSSGFMWFVTALVVIFAIILFRFAFTRHKD